MNHLVPKPHLSRVITEPISVGEPVTEEFFAPIDTTVNHLRRKYKNKSKNKNITLCSLVDLLSHGGVTLCSLVDLKSHGVAEIFFHW